MALLQYMKQNIILLVVLFLVLLCTLIVFLLYLRERRKERALEASVKGEREFYQAFAGTEDIFYITVRKSDLRVLFVSPNFEKMTGIESHHLKADIEVLKELVSKNTARRVKKALEQWNQEEVLNQQFSYYPVGKKEHYASVTIRPDEKGENFLISFFDITKEHAVNEEYQKKLEEAAKESQAKTAFLSKMSHEIRTPMNGLLGMLQLSRVHLNHPDEVANYLDKAETLSQFLLHLINDILDMSRIESGKMELEEASFDLFAVADRLNSMFLSTADSKGILWKVEMQDFDVRNVVGDELRLTQVIINFISNALKFTPEGGSVNVTFRQMNKIEGNLHLMIRVRDTGKGIKREFLDRIFRPFEQEDASTAHNYGGSGLGMAIADNIVQLMNGQILVESEEGKGTEVVVYVALPIAEGEQVIPENMEYDLHRAAGNEKMKQWVENFKLQGLHLLLAEDNDINAEIATEILEMEGAEIERAVDGIEVVDKFKESEPGAYDAILMDIQMPGQDGWEATQKIRTLNHADAQRIPIIAMSANAFVEDKRHSLEVGMDGHISKPVDFEELRRVIAEVKYTKERTK